MRLSQQELMDCSWGEGNNACDGGEDFRSYQWIMKHGQATEGDYGQYKAQVGDRYKCLIRLLCTILTRASSDSSILYLNNF